MADRVEPISNLQVLRGLSALAIVFYHTAYFLPGGIHTDFLAVPVFFVISGFIMTYITREDASGFLAKRFVRIVPLYWITTLFLIVWTGFGFSNPSYTFPLWAELAQHKGALAGWIKAQAAGAFPPDLPGRLIESLLFVPVERYPLNAVGWTLNLEVFFYLVFGASLWASRKWAPLISCTALVVVKLVWPSSFYAHGYTTYFIAGVVAFYLWRWLGPHAPKWRRATIGFALLVAAAEVGANALLSTIPPPLGLLLPPTIVLAALLLHSAGVRCANRPVLLLGGASYALYLIHPGVIETGRTLFDFGTSLVGLFGILSASVLVAVAIYLWIEQPLLRLLRPRAGHAARRVEPATQPV